jgi:hypothetical protein
MHAKRRLLHTVLIDQNDEATQQLKGQTDNQEDANKEVSKNMEVHTRSCSSRV